MVLLAFRACHENFRSEVYKAISRDVSTYIQLIRNFDRAKYSRIMKRLYSLLLLVLFVAVVGACGGGDEPTPTPVPPTATPIPATPTEPPADPEPTAEPEAEEAPSALDSPLGAPFQSPLQSPLAEPEANLAPALNLPPAPEVELTESTGAITGVIIAKGSDGNFKALANVTIGLGDLVPDEETNEAIAAAYDPRESIRTTTDMSGRFVLNGVPPSKNGYGLILDSVINAVLLSYPDGHESGNGSIIFNVEPNTLVDLGELRYETLPLYGFTN